MQLVDADATFNPFLDFDLSGPVAATLAVTRRCTLLDIPDIPQQAISIQKKILINVSNAARTFL